VPERWPSALWLVRHGESVGNVAAREAATAGREEIDISVRDADADLTHHGRRQAETVGAWLASLPPDQKPQVALVSPYLRTRQTAEIALDRLGHGIPVRLDERIRDRELGVLDRLTAVGVEARYPAEAAARRKLGKFYHRPAGGESWADVLLRVRSAITDLRACHGDQRVLVVTHDVVVLLFRYVIEGLDEQGVLDISRSISPVNCGITSYELNSDRGLVLRGYNLVIDRHANLEESRA
jgi:probable phosphoglycerate mutase